MFRSRTTNYFFMNDVSYGGAKYVGTGRGFSIKHNPFVHVSGAMRWRRGWVHLWVRASAGQPCSPPGPAYTPLQVYSMYSRSHLYFAFELLFILVLLAFVGGQVRGLTWSPYVSYYAAQCRSG